MVLQLNCPPTLVVVSIAGLFIISIFLHSHKTFVKIFQFLITVYFIYTSLLYLVFFLVTVLQGCHNVNLSNKTFEAVAKFIFYLLL